MSDALNLQSLEPEPVPAAAGEEKGSMLSYWQCYNSAVSVVLCQTIRRAI
jgi:hypothetical protein